MSRQLVESIIDKDFVLAESHFNDRLDAIMEKKLYEKKRMVACKMDEALGRVGEVQKSNKKTGSQPEVQPDPEARVRGGKTKAQPLLRKLTAKTIKFGRKYGGSEFRKSYLTTKQQTQAASDAAPVDTGQEKRRKAPPKSVEKTDDVKDKPITSGEKFRNALMGREIDYRKEKETDPNKKPGVAGFLGKVARGALKGAESGLHSMEE